MKKLNKKKFGNYEVSGLEDLIICKVKLDNENQYFRLNAGNFEFSFEPEFISPEPIEWDCWMGPDFDLGFIDKGNFILAIVEMISRYEGKVKFSDYQSSEILKIIKKIKGQTQNLHKELIARGNFLAKSQNLLKIL